MEDFNLNSFDFRQKEKKKQESSSLEVTFALGIEK